LSLTPLLVDEAFALSTAKGGGGFSLGENFPSVPSLLLRAGRPSGGITAGDVQAALQDFIICCEMLGISVMHHWAFTYEVLVKEATQSRPNPNGANGPQWLPTGPKNSFPLGSGPASPTSSPRTLPT
jgi:hypothetical protein